MSHIPGRYVPTKEIEITHSSAASGKMRWRPRKPALQYRALVALGLSDLCIIVAAFCISAYLGQAQGNWWVVFTALLLPAYFIIAASNHAFESYALANPFIAVGRGCRALLTAVALFILIAFFAKITNALPRLTLTLGTLLSIALLSISRYIMVRHLPKIIGGDPFCAILIFDGEQRVSGKDFNIIIAAESFFDPDIHDPHMYDRLATSLLIADRVVIDCPLERRDSWAHALQGANIQAEIIIPELNSLSPLGLGPDFQLASVIVAAGPLGLFPRLVKRLFDLTITVSALVILLPLMAFVAILIKFDSPGPILFRQPRIGRGNQIFQIYKFRSMRSDLLDTNADKLTLRNDARVTRVGGFIRKTSIDELPQLINILLGEMSIVGPRPHAIGAKAATKLYWEVDGRYWHRHSAKPGLTGLAQVRGFRGNTEVEIDLLNRLNSDLEYLKSWSIWRDIKIVFLTVRVILHRNAF